MTVTWQQLRHSIAQQTGLYWSEGEYDADASTSGYLVPVGFAQRGQDHLNGFHLLLTDGDVSPRELHIRSQDVRNNRLGFLPILDEGPSGGGRLEVLPFAATEFLRAAQVAIQLVYDEGVLRRQFWMRMIGGSPIYNADFIAWRDGLPEGWLREGTVSVTQVKSDENTALSETSVALTGTGLLVLAPTWQRFLPTYYDNDDFRLHCWVKASTPAAGIGIRTRGESLAASAFHTGSGAWELLEVQASLRDDDPKLDLVLIHSDPSPAYFNMPFVENDSQLVYQYPFPISALPHGPQQVTFGWFHGESDEPKYSMYVGRQSVLVPPRFLTSQHPGTDNKFGILDFSLHRRRLHQHQIMLLRGDTALSSPRTILDSTLIEVTDNGALLLASYAAKHLLQRASTGMAPSTVLPYTQRIGELDAQIAMLSEGAGTPRDVATYGLGW